MLDSTGRRVVYWLGAGASANALPVVGQMPAALRTHAGRLQSYADRNRIVFTKRDLVEEDMTRLAELAVSYGTVDTYARSLYLQGNKQHELNELKHQLSLFFIIEPLLMGLVDRNERTEIKYLKSYDVDPRYMGWLALMLGDDLRLNPRVNVISWNYDFQLELGLARFCQANQISNLYNRYRIHPEPSVSTAKEGEHQIIHLNGIAGQQVNIGGIDAWYEKHWDGRWEELSRLITAYPRYSDEQSDLAGGFGDRLTFAWENKEVAVEAVKQAENILAAADVLVVIGYSFPAFNRLVDKRLLSAFQKGVNRKNLVLQSPIATVENFRNLFDIDKDLVTLSVDNGCEQFHLPLELFND